MSTADDDDITPHPRDAVRPSSPVVDDKAKAEPARSEDDTSAPPPLDEAGFDDLLAKRAKLAQRPPPEAGRLPRSLASVRSAPPSKPPAVGFVPLAPSAFVAFANIPRMLTAKAEAWLIPPEALPERTDLKAYALIFEEWLSRSGAKAAGIADHNGELVWAPLAAWRMSYFVAGSHETAAVASMHGQAIHFPSKYGGLNCYPILSCQALAMMFNAKTPPPEGPEQDLLEAIRDIEQPSLVPPAPLHVSETFLRDKSAAVPSQSKDVGGRPLKWDWAAFTREMVRLANTVDGLPDRAKTTRHMQDWCVANWGDEPAESLIRKRVAELYPDHP